MGLLLHIPALQFCYDTLLQLNMTFYLFFYFSLSVIQSLSGAVKQLGLMLSLLIPQPCASKLFIIQSIIFSLFWTPVHEMKRQAANAVFLYLSSGKHNLPRLHSPPKHTSALLTRTQAHTCIHIQKIHLYWQTHTSIFSSCVFYCHYA